MAPNPRLRFAAPSPLIHPTPFPLCVQLVAELISAPRQSLLSFLDKHFPTVPKYVPEVIPSHQELVDTAALYHAKGLPYDLQGGAIVKHLWIWIWISFSWAG